MAPSVSDKAPTPDAPAAPVAEPNHLGALVVQGGQPGLGIRLAVDLTGVVLGVDAVPGAKEFGRDRVGRTAAAIGDVLIGFIYAWLACMKAGHGAAAASLEASVIELSKTVRADFAEIHERIRKGLSPISEVAVAAAGEMPPPLDTSGKGHRGPRLRR